MKNYEWANQELEQRFQEQERLIAELHHENETLRGNEERYTASKKTEAILRSYERIVATSREHMSLLGRHYDYLAVNDFQLKDCRQYLLAGGGGS